MLPKAIPDCRDHPMQTFRDRLAQLPSGAWPGRFCARVYDVVINRPLPGIVKLFARERGGNDIVSFNHYTTEASGPLLKPCEMSSAKVIDFVLGVEPLAA